MRHSILFVDNSADAFVSHRAPLASAAAAAGLDVHVATPAAAAGQRLLGAMGFRVHTADFDRGGFSPVAAVRGFRSLRRVIRRVRPTILHLRTVKPVVFGGLAALTLPVPVVVTHVTGLGTIFHSDGVAFRALRALLQPLYRIIHAHACINAIFQNPDDRDAMLRYGMVPANKACLIRGSGVDTEHVRPSPLPPWPPLIVLPARMNWDKGIREFIEAATALSQRGVVARFALAGDLDAQSPRRVPEEALRAAVSTGAVEWHGHERDVASLMRRAAIICLPSYHEGLPKALLEAAASGRPIVTTDVNGCRETCRHERNGLLVPAKDSEALAVALQRLIDDPPLCARMGSEGRSIVEKEFSLARVLSETLSLYARLVRRSSADRASARSRGQWPPRHALQSSHRTGLQFMGSDGTFPFR